MSENAQKPTLNTQHFPADQVQAIARQITDAVILQHLNLCPFTTLHIEKRLRTLELSYAKLIGFMLGSGLLGGAAGGALVTEILP